MKIGIISDIHEDAERLQITVSKLEKENCDEIVCLGDLSGFDERFYSYKFSKNFKYCLDVVKVNCRVFIPGNHDLNHIKKLPDYNSVFHFPEDWYLLSFSEKKNFSKGNIWLYENDSPIEELDQFNNFINNYNNNFILEIDDLRILFSHSVYPDISGFLTRKPSKVSDFSDHFDLLKKNNCNLGFSGHLHPNGLLRIEEGKIHFPKYTQLNYDVVKLTQYICPCIADGIQDNGYTIIDTDSKTVESFPLRTPRHFSNFI